jgi:hypothetical protein
MNKIQPTYFEYKIITVMFELLLESPVITSQTLKVGTNRCSSILYKLVGQRKLNNLRKFALKLGATNDCCFINFRPRCEISGSHGGELKMTAFWNNTPCCLVEDDRRFRGAYCPHHQGNEMEAVRTSKTSVNFYDTTRGNIPEGCHLLRPR